MGLLQSVRIIILDERESADRRFDFIAVHLDRQEPVYSIPLQVERGDRLPQVLREPGEGGEVQVTVGHKELPLIFIIIN